MAAAAPGHQDRRPPARLLPARAAPGPASLREHLARHGPLPPCGPGSRWREDLIAEVERAGLTGRGGAGFPAARKLAAVVAGRRSPVVIGNGTEGEPASAKDKVLLAREPHLVLDGAVAAAELVGASRAVIVAHPAVAGFVAAAAAERRQARLDRIRIRVMAAASGFVAGEATAVVHWVERGVPKPTPTPPRVSERGLDGLPTLVHNVETLAHLALIVRHGAAWFREAGTPAEPGTMLVTVAGAVRRPGVFEIGIGTGVGEVLGLAGGPARPLRALLLGGYFGTWADAAAAMPLPFSAAGLAPLGAGPGAGLIAALPAGACGLAETAALAGYLAAQSAGQCGPCVFGLAAIAAELAALADGRPADLGLVTRWLGQVEGRGGCRHPDGAVRMIRSALALFGDEIGLHVTGWCSAVRREAVLPVPVRSRT
jgi:NADH:ubiquinone oxidoreductase subunit F (NADH-binding)